MRVSCLHYAVHCGTLARYLGDVMRVSCLHYAVHCDTLARYLGVEGVLLLGDAMDLNWGPLQGLSRFLGS